MEIQDKLSEGEYIDGQFIDKDYIDRKMKDYNKNRRYKLYDEWSYNFGIIVVLLLIFFLILLLNSYTTFVADDFNNLFTKSGERISSIKDIFLIQKNRYYSINGRAIAHGMGQFMLMFDKSFINFFNSIFFCTFVYSIYRFVVMPDDYGLTGNSKYLESVINSNKYGRHIFKTGVLILVFLLVWNYTPVFGQTYLWVIGAANYMWTSLMILAVLHISRRVAIINDTGHLYMWIPLIVILCFLTGWTNENTVVGLLFVLAYQLIKMMIDNTKGISIMVMMTVSTLMGFIIMITAPGNFARMKLFNEPENFSVKLILRFTKMSQAYSKYIMVLFIICLIFVIVSRIMDMRKNLETEVYFVAGLLSFWSMLAAPTFPPRAMVGTVFFFIAAIVMSIATIDRRDNKLSALIVMGMILFTGYGFVKTVPDAILASSEYLSKYNARELVILDNKSSGNVQNVEVPALPAENKYMAGFGLGGCEQDPKNWINVTIARYYGIGSVVLRK